MLFDICMCRGELPEDIDDLIYGSTGTVPSERLIS